MSRPRIAVVGGGLAGMTAALAAADGGAEVTVVERRRRLGGLTWSFERNGRWFDNGQHVFLRCCDQYLRFLDRIGAARDVVVQPRLDVPVVRPGGRTVRIRRSRGPAPLHLAGALAGYRHLGLADRLRLPLAAVPLRFLDPADPSLDTITFGQWLHRHHQHPAAVEALWNLIALPTINLPADQASLTVAAKVFRTGLLERAAAGDIGWARVPLAHLHDTPGRRALARSGVRTLLGKRVRAVRRQEDGAWRVTGDGVDVTADAVVLALPPQPAAEVVPAGCGPDPVALGASPIVNVHLVFDRRVTDLPLAAGLDSPVQFVFDRTNPADGGGAPLREQHLAVSLSAAGDAIGQRPELLVRRFHQAVGELFPAAHHAQLLDAVVTREHQATFRATPGSGAARFGPRGALPGLAWAGAWTDTGWPATMEGAVRSGLAAAAVALGAPHVPGPSRTSTTDRFATGRSTTRGGVSEPDQAPTRPSPGPAVSGAGRATPAASPSSVSEAAHHASAAPDAMASEPFPTDHSPTGPAGAGTPPTRSARTPARPIGTRPQEAAP